MAYFVASLDQIRGPNNYQEYMSVIADLEQAAIRRAQGIWTGWTRGGMFPQGNQFGLAALRKNDMANDVTDSALSSSYNFNVPSAAANAWRDIFRYTVPDNTLHAFAGFSFTDDVLRFAQLRFEFQDRLYPIMDIQYCQGFNKFNLVFKTDAGSELIAEPSTRVLIRGYQLNTGVQRVVPIGVHVYKNRSRVITET